MTAVRRSKPQIVAVPSLGSRIPVNIFSVVDLPAPFGPRNPTICPAGISNVNASTANREPNRLVNPCKAIMCALTPSGNRPPTHTTGKPCVDRRVYSTEVGQ